MEALESVPLVSQNTSNKLSEELDDQSAELDRLHQYFRRNCIIESEIPVKKNNETCEDLIRSFERNVIKDMGENSKEEFDFEYDKSTSNIRLKPSLTKKRMEFLCNATERIKDDNT